MGDSARLWQVRVTVAGPPMEPLIVKRALERLSEQHAFLSSVRYGADRAEISYWDEADTLIDIGSLALRLWTEHRESANLPPWEVVGLEVIEREAMMSRTVLESLSTSNVLPLPF